MICKPGRDQADRSLSATFAGPRVDALAVIGDGDSASLVAGGLFDLAGGASVGNLATWGCVEP